MTKDEREVGRKVLQMALDALGRASQEMEGEGDTESDKRIKSHLNRALDLGMVAFHLLYKRR